MSEIRCDFLGSLGSPEASQLKAEWEATARGARSQNLQKIFLSQGCLFCSCIDAELCLQFKPDPRRSSGSAVNQGSCAPTVSTEEWSLQEFGCAAGPFIPKWCDVRMAVCGDCDFAHHTFESHGLLHCLAPEPQVPEITINQKICPVSVSNFIAGCGRPPRIPQAAVPLSIVSCSLQQRLSDRCASVARGWAVLS